MQYHFKYIMTKMLIDIYQEYLDLIIVYFIYCIRGLRDFRYLDAA